MANIQSQFSIVHADSGLNVSSALVRSSYGAQFTPIAVSVGSVDEVVDLGDVTTAKDVYIKWISGDALLVGLDGSTYPFRLKDSKEWMKLRLDVEGIVETSTIVCEADVNGALGGAYFDIRELDDDVIRVWLDTGNGAGTKATGSITYGVPVAAAAATGSITYGAPDNTDTVIVNGTTLTKVASSPSANEFTTIGELEILVEALTGINSSEDGTTVSISAATAGTAGNAITLALGGGNTGTMAISGATLTGGLDADTVIVNGTTLTKVASAPSAGEFSSISELEVLVEAIANIDSTEDGTTVSISAAAVGYAGNSYTLALGAGNTGTMAISGATLTGGLNTSIAPSVTTQRLLPVVITQNGTATSIGAAIAAAFVADASLYATSATGTVTVTDTNTGTRTAIADGTTGWATFTASGTGAASPVVHLKSVGTTSAVVVVAPN